MTQLSASPASYNRLVSSVDKETNGLFDENYLGALKERNSTAEDYLVSYFSRPVLLKLRARLRSPELIEDAHQETFLRVFKYFRSGKTIDNPASLPGFIHGVCQNVALEFLRGYTRQAQIPENLPEPIDSRAGPESRMMTEERKELVRQLLSELSEKDRQLLRCVFLDEEDKDAVCNRLHVNRSYLRVLLFRSRQRLKAVVARSNTRTAGGAV